MLGLTGFLGLARIPLFGGSHRSHRSHGILCGWEISQTLLRVGWLARIPLCFWAHTDSTDPTVLLCGWEISQMLLCVGWLARIPLGFWAHTDLTDPTVLLCGWEISQIGSVYGLVWAPMGAHCSRSHGLIFRTLRTNQTYRTYRTNWTFLKIIREICGICVRPPWDWDLCEASVDSVWAGDKITKNCVIWGAF